MNKFLKSLIAFVREEDGSATNEYGSNFILLAIGMFIVFAVFQSGILACVSCVADGFVNKIGAMTVASDRRFQM